MGNNIDTLNPKIHYPCTHSLQNFFRLSPYETDWLNYLFTQYTKRERRMHFNDFFKLFKRINPHLSKENLKEYALIAFREADSNCDGSISFDEFVDAYTCFRATPDFPRVINSGLFL